MPAAHVPGRIHPAGSGKSEEGFIGADTLNVFGIVNGCIRAYFMEVFGRCREQADPNDMMLRMMEQVVS